MTSLRLVWDLAHKDLLLFMADRRGMLLCFGVPILLASIFGAIFYRSGPENIRPHVFVVVEEQDSFTRRLLKVLQTCDQLQVTTGDEVSARRRLSSESSGVVVYLPRGLDQVGLLGKSNGQQPTIRLCHAPNAHLESRLIEGLLTEILFRELARDQLAAVGRNATIERPFAFEQECVSAGGALSVNSYNHSFCGMTLQYLLFWGMDSGLLFLRERRLGIWRRLRAAPIDSWHLLLGKTVATALIALVLIAVTFTFGAVFFGVGITGSLAGFALMTVAAALLSAATGLLVAALGGNEGRARSVAILVILTLSLLGGLWLPQFLLPGWVQTISLLLPTTWAARGLEGVTWQGMDLAGAWPCALILVGYSVGFLLIACWKLAYTNDSIPTEGSKTWVG